MLNHNKFSMRAISEKFSRMMREVKIEQNIISINLPKARGWVSSVVRKIPKGGKLLFNDFSALASESMSLKYTR